jgi:hypothetical protein
VPPSSFGNGENILHAERIELVDRDVREEDAAHVRVK